VIDDLEVYIFRLKSKPVFYVTDYKHQNLSFPLRFYIIFRLAYVLALLMS